MLCRSDPWTRRPSPDFPGTNQLLTDALPVFQRWAWKAFRIFLARETCLALVPESMLACAVESASDSEGGAGLTALVRVGGGHGKRSSAPKCCSTRTFRF